MNSKLHNSIAIYFSQCNERWDVANNLIIHYKQSHIIEFFSLNKAITLFPLYYSYQMAICRTVHSFLKSFDALFNLPLKLFRKCFCFAYVLLHAFCRHPASIFLLHFACVFTCHFIRSVFLTWATWNTFCPWSFYLNALANLFPD